ncbi:MAG: multiheme c-type cytochrome [Planctomycetaceae bacterium]
MKETSDADVFRQSRVENNAESARDSDQFVGSATCLECHQSEHASYLHTAHSQAMSVVAPAKEPPDTSFDHKPSGRRYRVFRKNGELWHSEELQTSDNGAGQRNDHEKLKIAERLEFLIGSGRHSRTYAVKRNNILIESPITWYQSKQSWAMSPGYDHPHHDSFERATDFGCLICHVGNVESSPDHGGQLKIVETAIGCERCHGPGAEHAEKWRNSSPTASRSGQDSTIVNPRRLTRERSESICAQCHLRGNATVLVSGKSLRDFLPGMLLTDVRIDYRLTSNSDTMKVVGHVDQMHASRCFQKSESLSCITCHDMHKEQSKQNDSELYQRQCLECHQSSSCGLPSEQRLQQVDNNCVKCHMPQVPTDIPHIAFTHHRIGVHDETLTDPQNDSSELMLEPFYPVNEPSPSEKSQRDSLRNLSLAYLELADKQSDPDEGTRCREKAAKLLQQIIQTDSADGDVYAAMGRMAWEQNAPEAAIRYSHLAITNPRLSDGARINSLLVAGDSHLQLNQSALAVTHLRQLTNLRNRSQDWWLLGMALYQSGDREIALDALATAVSIQPFRGDIRRTYSQMLQDQGRTKDSIEQLRLAEYLEK